MKHDNEDTTRSLGVSRRRISGSINIQNVGSALPAIMKNERRMIFASVVSGIVLAVVGLHPLIELFHWWRTGPEGGAPVLRDLLGPSISAFSLEMAPMTAVIVVGGGLAGLLFAVLQIRLFRWRSVNHETRTMDKEDLMEIIRIGESERIEFKSSLRWDERLERVNKKLELAIAKSVAGFMNRDGGELLIGVGDHGEIKGIERDCQTLSRSDWDGFERSLMNMVTDRLGAVASTLIRNRKYGLDSKSVCRVSVQPATEPVFCKDGNIERYYVRTGNTTRELDAHEAVDYITRRHGAVAR
ncbi:MAG: ATP-binding protein [Opitutaceae bacterium]